MSATITALVPSTSRAAVTPSSATPSSAAPVDRSAVPTTGHLRITRRGRLVLTLAVLVSALALVAGFILTGGSAVATSSAGNVSFEHVTVAAGETLWQVAENVAPDSDPRDVISDIVSLNDLSTTQVMPGQSLAIPLKYDQN